MEYFYNFKKENVCKYIKIFSEKLSSASLNKSVVIFLTKMLNDSPESPKKILDTVDVVSTQGESLSSLANLKQLQVFYAGF